MPLIMPDCRVAATARCLSAVLPVPLQGYLHEGHISLVKAAK